MADQSLEILIKFGLSDAAAKQALVELKQLEGATGDAAKSTGKLAEATAKDSKETGKAAVSKNDLKAAVRGLHQEFPLLSRAAHMALNPITLGVAGIAAAFGIWRDKTRELTRTLSQVELPNLSPQFLAGLEKHATAWNNIATAVGKAVEAYNSVERASDRIATSIKKQADNAKELLEAKRGLELAELEASGASATDKLTKRLEIDARYRSAGLEIEKQTARQMLAAQHVKKASLEIDARSKAEAADKIKIGTEAQDDLTEAEHKRRADAARADIEERRNRIQEAEDFSARSFLGRAIGLPSLFKFGNRYGYDVKTEDVGKVAQQIEGGIIASEQPIVDRYENFVLQRRNRRKLQERREDLTQQSGQEFAAAATIGLSLPAATLQAKADEISRNQIAAIKSLTDIANYHRETVEAMISTAREMRLTNSRLQHRYD